MKNVHVSAVQILVTQIQRPGSTLVAISFSFFNKKSIDMNNNKVFNANETI